MKRIVLILAGVLLCIVMVGQESPVSASSRRAARKARTEEVARQREERNRQRKASGRRRLTKTQKLKAMKADSTSATLTLTDKTMIDRNLEALADMSAHRDSIVVKDERTGQDMIFMRAVRDESTGEDVLTEVLDAAVVTARFRNVAERNGKVDLEFDITVPRNLYDSKWQLRFYPYLTMLDKTTKLDAVYITGSAYRREQLRGYERYNRFIQSIITDPTKFVDLKNLERFIKRNIPALYYFKTDSTFVSETQFRSIFGVSEQQAIDHYTDRLAIAINNRKLANRGKMWRRYVKSPIVEEGIRLDTVIQNLNGDYVYSYTQTIRTSRNLRKADIVLEGDIYEEAKKIYTMPTSDPLTFYISSLSSFIDPTPRYLLQVIEKKATANMAYRVDFEVGKATVEEYLRDNYSEIGRIKENLRTLMNNEVFDLDSIIVTAFASPEGSVKANTDLCRRRAESVGAYFDKYVKHYQDSLRRDAGMSIDLTSGDGRMTSVYKGMDIRFMSRNGGENWKQLTQEVEINEVLDDEQKAEYMDLLQLPDLDMREARLKKIKDYKYIKDVIYPVCRTVHMEFNLSRKGMVKDTIHSTVLDSTYMRGIELMRDREYEKAVVILRPYQDYNAAVAFCAMDYNVSAMTILQDLEPTPQVEYLKAIIYSRNGEDQKAVQCFMNAANADRSYFNRGNLDPEIRAIIKRYKLDKVEDDFDYGDTAF